MEETKILMLVMAVLGIIEISLIIAIYRLRTSLESINENAKVLKEKINSISENMLKLYEKAKSFGSGELTVSGNTPFGSVDLQLQLGDKKE